MKPNAILITVPQQTYFNREDMEITPRIGIVSLIKWANKYGYDVGFYDIDMLLPSDDKIKEYFKKEKPNIIGISAVVSTSYNQVKNLVKIIKEVCPSALIILGGHMAVASNVLLRNAGVDVCVLGDGEKTFIEIIKYVENNEKKEHLNKIKGITFIDENGEMQFTGYGEPIDNNELVFPDYDILSKGVPNGYPLLNHYIRPTDKTSFFMGQVYKEDKNIDGITAKMWVTRGCVGRCTFCQRFTKGFQTYDLGLVEDYVKFLKEKYNVRYIIILGENFIADKKFSLKVAEVFKKHGITWVAQGVRPGTITLNESKFFYDCGCIAINYGVESGSQKILNIMQKGYTVNEIFNSLEISFKTNITSRLWFCLAMPGESDETIKESSKFICKIALMRSIPPNKFSIGLSYASPLPGSPLYEYGKFQGIIGNSLEEEEDFLINISDIHNGKDVFVNLTGKPMKDVLFWEFLLHYESIKLYYKEIKNKKAKFIENKLISKRTVEKRTPILRKIWLYKNRLFKLLLTKPISGLNTILISTKIPVYVPRWILYPFMKNLLYLEYLLKSFNNKLYKYQKIKLKYNIDFDEKGKPLREVNDILRKNYPLPKTLTEKNQALLYLGR